MVVVKSSPIAFECDEWIENNIKEGIFSSNGETDQNPRTKRAATANRSSLTSFVWTTGNRILINFVSDIDVTSDFYGSYVSL